MMSSTSVSMVHGALHAILLTGMAAGIPTKFFDTPLESIREYSQVPTECIYSHDVPPPELPSIMYPLYYADPAYNSTTGICTDKYIKNVSKGCRAILAVVNPGSGPAIFNSDAYHGYQACTRMMGKSGVQMVGYVKTKVAHKQADGVWRYDGFRDMPSIKKDIDHWHNNFAGIPGFKGIFVDETSNYYEIHQNKYNVTNHIEIYQEIITYIKENWKNSLVVLNPGSFTSPKLLAAAPGFPEPADISIPWEDYAWRWRPEGDNCTTAQIITTQGNWGIGPWCKYVPERDHVEEFKKGVSNRTFKAAAFLHSNEKGIEFAKQEARTAALWNFTYFYSTNLALRTNPWKSLPDYWEEYLKFLNDYAFVKVNGKVDILPTPLNDAVNKVPAP